MRDPRAGTFPLKGRGIAGSARVSLAWNHNQNPVAAFPHPGATVSRGSKAAVQASVHCPSSWAACDTACKEPTWTVWARNPASDGDACVLVRIWETSAPFCQMAARRGAKTLWQVWWTVAHMGWKARRSVTHEFLGWSFKTKCAHKCSLSSSPLTPSWGGAWSIHGTPWALALRAAHRHMGQGSSPTQGAWTALDAEVQGTEPLTLLAGRDSTLLPWEREEAVWDDGDSGTHKGAPQRERAWKLERRRSTHGAALGLQQGKPQLSQIRSPVKKTSFFFHHLFPCCAYAWSQKANAQALSYKTASAGCKRRTLETERRELCSRPVHAGWNLVSNCKQHSSGHLCEWVSYIFAQLEE